MIALGVTGGIAAYKACEIVRGLDKAGVEVQVVMTRQAARFITPLTLQALSGQPVFKEMFQEGNEASSAVTGGRPEPLPLLRLGEPLARRSTAQARTGRGRLPPDADAREVTGPGAQPLERKKRSPCPTMLLPPGPGTPACGM